jgi:hypothetical protein
VVDPTPAPDLDEAPGWVVLDPDGNVVDSGPVIQALAVSSAGEAESAEGAE